MNDALFIKLPEKGALVKVCYDEPRYGVVISVLSKEETKKLGVMGQKICLYMYDTGREEVFFYGWEVIEDKIQEIAKAVEISNDTIIPTDTQGLKYSARCIYRGKTYSIELRTFSNRTIPEQAAEWIYQQLLHESTPASMMRFS